MNTLIMAYNNWKGMRILSYDASAISIIDQTWSEAFLSAYNQIST